MSLAAWIGNKRVGTLTHSDATGQFGFAYEQGWIAARDSFPLSPALPFASLQDDPPEIHSARVRRFFENLLPEGQALDDAARAAGLGRGNLYGLVRALGRESAGAIALLPEGERPDQLTAIKRPVPLQELSDRIRSRREIPFSVWDGKVRMSIAGLQDKLSVYQDADESLHLVEGSLASTHILKPEPDNDRIRHLVANEHFCLALANALGLPVASARILRVPEPVLVVERFDRRRVQEGVQGVQRLHIIDACQALDLPASSKYERNLGSGRDVIHIREGASFEKLFSLTGYSANQAADRMALLRWAIIQFLIGNSDAHGKNVSFFVSHAGLAMAPAYDLVAITLYDGIDHDLAMGIGDDFKLDDVRAFSWADFAVRCGLERRLVAREMKRCAAKAAAAIEEILGRGAYTEDETKLLEKAGVFVRSQAARLLEFADEVPKIDESHLRP